MLCCSAGGWAVAQGLDLRDVARSGGSSDDFLKPDQAFVLTAESARADQVTLRWQIARDYYLYRDKIRLALDPGSDRALFQKGRALERQGKLDEAVGSLNEAIAEYRAAYDIYSELLGAGSPFARAAASDLAMAERAANRR